MTIDRISVGGFANIQEISLDLSGINALIAPNGYGKSNVLKAICFGADFISASEQKRAAMMQDDTVLPINRQNDHMDFTFEISGKDSLGGEDVVFHYGYSFSWRTRSIGSEFLRMRNESDQRFRSAIIRKASGSFLYLPSVGCRCNKNVVCTGSELAVGRNDIFARVFYASLIGDMATLSIPRLETMENPDSYFSTNRRQVIPFLDNMSANEYIYWLMKNKPHEYSLFKDGIMQMLGNLETFEPYEAKVGEGLDSTLYDIRVKDINVTQETSINRLSAGSKRMVFLFLAALTANIKGVPLMMLEEPENSVHPKLLEDLLLLLKSYAEDTKVLFASHSPYLARYMNTKNMYFGLPDKNGLARFAKIREKKRKYLHKYASAMELTVGEFMFDFMLDVEDDTDKVEEFFDVQR